MSRCIGAVLTIAILLAASGCKTGLIPDARPQGPRAKVEDMSVVTRDLSDFKHVEVELPRNDSSATLAPEFLRGIRQKTVETLAALWLFEVVMGVDESETGRELAPTLIVQTRITRVGAPMKIGALTSGCHVTAEVTFIEKISGTVLGAYRLQAPVKGETPFSAENNGAFTRFSLAITDILEDHAPRAADKRWGG